MGDTLSCGRISKPKGLAGKGIPLPFPKTRARDVNEKGKYGESKEELTKQGSSKKTKSLMHSIPVWCLVIPKHSRVISGDAQAVISMSFRCHFVT